MLQSIVNAFGGNSAAQNKKINSDEFKNSRIDVSVLNKETVRKGVVAAEKLQEVLEECQRLHPDMDFGIEAREKRRKFTSRVSYQILSHEQKVCQWKRTEAEFAAVRHLDDLVGELMAESKVQTAFQQNGLLGGQPVKQKRNMQQNLTDITQPYKILKANEDKSNHRIPGRQPKRQSSNIDSSYITPPYKKKVTEDRNMQRRLMNLYDENELVDNINELPLPNNTYNDSNYNNYYNNNDNAYKPS
jgi:hypothetical protein